MGFLIMICGSAGIYGVYKLSGLIDFITQNVWETADGTMEGLSYLEKEVRIVQDASQVQNKQINKKLILEIHQNAKNSLQRAFAAGMISKDRSEEVTAGLQAFSASRDEVLEAHQAFQAVRDELEQNSSQLSALLKILDQRGNQVMKDLKNQPAQSISWEKGLEGRWQAITGRMEAGIGYARLMAVTEKLLGGKEPQELAMEMQQALQFQDQASMRMMETTYFDDPAGELFPDESIVEAYQNLIGDQNGLIRQFFETFTFLQTVKSSYQINSETLFELVKLAVNEGNLAIEALDPQISSLKEQAILMIVISMIVAVLSSFIGAWLITGSITKPIHQMMTFIQELRKGRLDVNLSNKSQDEVGLMAQELNELVKTLHQRAEVADRVAEGDLAVTIHLNSDQDTLGQAIQRMLISLQEKNEAMQRVAAGDLSQTVKLSSTRDALGQTIASMMQGLEQKIELAKSVAAGDLTVEVPLASELDALGLALQAMVQGLSEKLNLAESVAEGDLETTVPSLSENDGLAEALQNMMTSLKDKVRVTESVAAGDLSTQIQLASEQDTLGIALQHMLGSLEEKSLFAEAVAAGDLDLEMKLASPKDKLGLALREMLGSLAEKANFAKDIANGDLTTQMNLASDKDQLGLSLQQMGFDLNHILSQVSSNSSQIMSLATQMSENSSVVVNASDQMSNDISFLASTAQQISSNVDSVAGTAYKLSQNMSLINESMQGLSVHTQEIFTRAGNASKISSDAQSKSGVVANAMEELNKSAHQIDEVTELIKEIAQQTNLLALNANIEAASAGDSGRGFAVVANEIKELAKQSSKAAESIASKIESMQGNTEHSVGVIQEMTQTIEILNESANEINSLTIDQQEAAVDVSQRINESTTGVNGISRLLEEASLGAKDLAQSSEKLAAGAVEVSRSITQVSSDTDSSAILSQELFGMIGRFKLQPPTEDTEIAESAEDI